MTLMLLIYADYISDYPPNLRYQRSIMDSTQMTLIIMIYTDNISDYLPNLRYQRSVMNSTQMALIFMIYTDNISDFCLICVISVPFIAAHSLPRHRGGCLLAGGSSWVACCLREVCHL
jgi:hypothetical protein